MSADNARAEALADFIATERDKYPRRADDMDSEELAQKIIEWLASRKPEAAPATPVSDTDEVFAILDELNASNQIGYDDYSRLHDAVSRASQPVQVEVTDDMEERVAEVFYKAQTGYGREHFLNSIYIDTWRKVARTALEAALGGGE